MDQVLADTLTANLKAAETTDQKVNALVLAEIAVVDCQRKTSERVKKLVADKARKVEKAAQKAKKKDTKNYNKWIEDTKKAKSKSSEDMAELYYSILELAELYD